MMISETFDDLDVPPLEDMSGIIKNMKKSSLASSNHVRPITTQLSSKKESKISLERSKPKEKEFSGLQKGFFSSKPKASSVPKTRQSAVQATVQTSNPKSGQKVQEKDDIPFLKANVESNQKNPLEFSEIREAMTSQFEKTRNEWMTPSFMEKIEKSPVLRKAFQDERFLAISQQLARDPIATIQKVSKELPHFIPALQEFTALIGEAMEEKAQEEELKKLPKLDDFEQGLIHRVMSDEKVQAALKDPKIQQLLLKLRSDPNQSISQMMNQSSPDLKAKIQSLIECGLLSIVQ